VLLTSHQALHLPGVAELTLPDPPPERVRRAA
jgi:hypothetical protein